MTGQIAVLINPMAGRGRLAGAVTKAIAELESGGRTVEILKADNRDEAFAVTRRAVSNGAAALVTVGGDGTVHIGIQAVAGTEVPLGVIPAGTGNDFALAVGVPQDPVEAAKSLNAALAQGRSRPIDLARIDADNGYQVWFGCVLAAGFDALVNERGNAMRWPKGRRRYDVAILRELVGLRARRYTVTLTGVDGGPDQVVERDANLVAVANTQAYGGGLRMAPHADPTDGWLDVVVGGPIGRITLLRLFPKLFRGTHITHPAVSSYRARQVRVAATPSGREKPIVGYADGERTCALPVTIGIHPGAARVLL